MAVRRLQSNAKKILAKLFRLVYNGKVPVRKAGIINGLSPNGKALDSDSSISRFESL